MKSSLTPCPDNIKQIQSWFASIITQPLNSEQKSSNTTPRGTLLETEAPNFVTPNAFLQPHERIQIYNQQYWWRLYKTLQEIFPTVARLFGYYDFNMQLVTPYLTKFPSKTWSLHELGRKMPFWISRNYKESDKAVILMFSRIDWAFQESFVAKSYPPLSLQNKTPDDLADMLSIKIKLQPHVHLFKCDGPFLIFRDSFLKESIDHWIENDFPSLPKDDTYHYLIYRNANNSSVHWETITAGQYKLLRLLKKGCSLIDACAILEEEVASIYQEAVQNIQQWFKTWTERELLIYAKA
ncbi:MAG: putative DNA-binding domain-containing protein [Chlamydiales bacterium]|nr:putative DNA-binding domain-containing protein [Chlamydiales bacterium]